MQRHLIVVSYLLVLAVGCSDDSAGLGPGETLQTFFDHLRNGEVDAAVELTSEAAIKDKGGTGEWKRFYAGLVPDFKASGGLTVEIVHESLKGRVAVLTFKLHYGNGQIEHLRYRMIKEHGKWKFDGKG